jgi:hypothetical protein
MSKYVNNMIPFQWRGNTQYLTCAQLLQWEWLREFRDRFANCFEYDPVNQIHIFIPGGK